LLKSPELKSTLQQSASLAAKQPENLKNVAENLRTNQRESQKTANIQNQPKTEQQQPEKLQGQEQKASLMEKMLSKVADKARDIKDMLGLQSKQQQPQSREDTLLKQPKQQPEKLQPRDESLRNQLKPNLQQHPTREDASLKQQKPQQQTPLRENIGAKVVPIREFGQNPAVNLKQPVQTATQPEKSAQLSQVTRSTQQQNFVQSNQAVSMKENVVAKPEVRAVENHKPAELKANETKKIDDKPDKPVTTKPIDEKKVDDKPPTSAIPKEVSWCCRPENKGLVKTKDEIKQEYQAPMDVTKTFAAPSTINRDLEKGAEVMKSVSAKNIAAFDDMMKGMPAVASR
jgi:hypothetical protein